MKNEIVKFDYESNEIRTITDDREETWFAGIDVCNILEYANSTQAIERLDEDERKLDYVTDSSGQRRKTWIISESGLYALILTSTKPEAKVFRKWVTGTVLPSIRKAGKYTSEEAKTKELELQRIVDEIERIDGVIDAYKSKIRDLNSEREKHNYSMRQIIRSNPNQLKLELNDTN